MNSFYNESNYYRVKYLLKKFVDENVDHLIITGDLTDNASEKDFQLLRNLLSEYDYLAGRKLTIIPGNHDIFGGVQKAEEIITFPEKCSKINYTQSMNIFISYFPESLENCIYISPNGYYPFAKIIGKVLIAGINSIAAYSKLNNPFASNGEVNATQFNEISNILKTNLPQTKYKIIAIHHHFNKYKVKTKSSLGSVWQNIEKQTMKLKNKRRLFNLFKEYKIDLVLHGHLHESKEYERKGTKFLNAGGTIKNEKTDTTYINYLKPGNENIKVSIEQIIIPMRSEVDNLIQKNDAARPTAYLEISGEV